MKKKTVSLVLGSGGARGLAHIGVIRWLEEHDFEIVSVSGCSIGTIVGGVYAAGKLDEFEDWMRTITKFDIVSLMDFNWGKGGLIKGDKVMNRLSHILGDLRIEDLSIPYTAVAADISNEKEVWLQKGSLTQAIRASISLPLYLMPIELNGRILIDGGVLNPVPIAPTFADHSDITLAVNLAGELSHKIEDFEINQVDISEQEQDRKDPQPAVLLPQAALPGPESQQPHQHPRRRGPPAEPSVLCCDVKPGRCGMDRLSPTLLNLFSAVFYT